MRKRAKLKVIECEPIGESVVERLEEVLEKAYAGEISSVAIAVVYRDGSTGSAWSRMPSVSTMIGAVARMQAGITATAEE